MMLFMPGLPAFHAPPRTHAGPSGMREPAKEFYRRARPSLYVRQAEPSGKTNVRRCRVSPTLIFRRE